MFQSWVALAIKSEVRIVLTLDKPVPTFVPITSPRLHREWLIEIILVSLLLVRVLQDCLDGLGRVERP